MVNFIYLHKYLQRTKKSVSFNNYNVIMSPFSYFVYFCFLSSKNYEIGQSGLFPAQWSFYEATSRDSEVLQTFPLCSMYYMLASGPDNGLPDLYRSTVLYNISRCTCCSILYCWKLMSGQELSIPSETMRVCQNQPHKFNSLK